MTEANVQLRERVKELKCLYELLRMAGQAGHSARDIAEKTMVILRAAMQYPDRAEVQITLDAVSVETPGFKGSAPRLAAPVVQARKNRGTVTIGYRKKTSSARAPAFLREEKNLLKAVARELGRILGRLDAEAEKDKLQTQLRQVERLAFMGELSAGIAHELNEPLGRILGFAQLIRKTGELGDQQGKDVERIIKASLYAREIIKKLMIFSRQMPRQLTAVNLNEVVANILYFMETRVAGRNIAITHKLAHSLPSIQADEVQMGQILVNLLTNAVHAMPDGGEVTIATARKKEGVGLSVRDTGEGMREEVRRKMFEPFFTTKPPGEGTGLGMSVVQGIVTAHQGKIQVNSQPGKGTRVDITLPAKQTPAKKKKP